MILVNKKTGEMVSQLGTSNISTTPLPNNKTLDQLGFAEVQFTEKPTDGFFEYGGIIEEGGVYKSSWVKVDIEPTGNLAIALLNTPVAGAQQCNEN